MALLARASSTARHAAPEEDNDRAGSTVRRWRELAGLAVFVAGAIVTVVWLSLLERGLTFFYDEWDFIDAHQYSYWWFVWQPHGGHPSMVPYTVYWVLLSTFGIRSYWPYLVVLTLVILLVGGLVFALLRRVVHPALAAAAAVVVMLMGPGWQDLLWAFQIGFLGSIAAGLGALLLLDRGTRRAHLAACGCLFVSVACSAVGVPFLAGIVIELCWRRQWRLLWVPALPLAGFGIWYVLVDRQQGATTIPRIGKGIHYVLQAAADSFGSLVGSNLSVGTVVGLIAAIAALIAVAALRRDAGRLLMATASVLVFWGLTVSARGATLPIASRYLIPGDVLLILGLGEVVRGMGRFIAAARTRLRPVQTLEARRGRQMVGALVTLTVLYSGLAIFWNSSQLVSASNGLNAVSQDVRTILGAVQATGHALPSNYQPNAQFVPQVFVGPYLEAVGAYGSAGFTPAELRRQSESSRALADLTILTGSPISIRPVASGSPDARKSCAQVGTRTAHGGLALNLPSHGLVVANASNEALLVRARLFARSFTQFVGKVTAGATAVVSWRGARESTLHWRLLLSILGSAPVPSVVRCSGESVRAVSGN